MSALVAEGADVDPWRLVPDGGDASVLPVPGLFSEVTACAGYAATRWNRSTSSASCSMRSAPMER